MSGRHLVLHGDDDVAVALEPREGGAVPALHKFARRDIASGETVRKYNEVIGYATCDIPQGTWVHTHNLEMGRLLIERRGVDAVSPPPDPTPISERYFLGYSHPSGRAGTRNYVVIASTVDCSAHVVELAAEELNRRREWISRRYAHVDGVIGLTHDSGCGLVALSPGHLRQNLTMRNLIDHPNVGAAVIVQLGCEKSQAALVFGEERVARLDATSPSSDPGTDTPSRTTLPVDSAARGGRLPVITIQERAGTWDTVEEIVRYVETSLLPAADRRRRVLVPASELVVALQCGGSDAASGLTANPAIGRAADLLVASGAAPFISETTETFGAEHLVARRAATKEIAERYLGFVASYREYLARGEGTPQHNLSHGNKERGLTTIAEKSLGAVAKAGSSPLRWVVDYGERITERGLGFMNGPAYDPASATGQTAGGAQVGVFSTGSGSCFGGILIPWIKVVSNTKTYERMVDMEIDAGGILDGADSIERVGRTVFESVLAAASGAKSYSERIGYSVVNIWNSGTVT